MMVNGRESDVSEITYPGLPQGSPLSPILYVFFNADLVQEVVNGDQGALGFVDDYTRWVVSDTIDQNMETLQSRVIPRALDWAASSGVTFEDDKTTLIHFIRDARLKKMPRPLQALQIGRALVPPSHATKVLGVTLDSQLTFKDHLAQVTQKAWRRVRMLSRLRGLRPGAVRQLYQSIVLSGLDYAASAWYARYLGRATPMFMQRLVAPIERYAAKVITNCFRTVSHEAACAEAGIRPSASRLTNKVWKFWVDIHTLPRDHLARKCLLQETAVNTVTAHRAPTTYMATAFGGRIIGLETIDAFTTAPWHSDTRSFIHIAEDREESAKQCTEAQGAELQLFTDASQRNGLTGYAVVVWMEGRTKSWRQRTIGREDQMSVHTGELAALMEAVDGAAFALTRTNIWRSATVYSDSKAALQTIVNPGRRSGQRIVRRIHEVMQDSRRRGHNIHLAWVPGHYNVEGNEKAHQMAAETTVPGVAVTAVPWLDAAFKSAILRRSPQTSGKCQLERPWKTGKYLQQIDAALPGTHVRKLYDTLTRREAQVLAQLRTGHSRLRGFLAKLGFEDSPACECGERVETVRHFLLHCPRYQDLRMDMIEEARDRYGDMSYMLGGRSRCRRPDGSWIDGPAAKWTPNLKAVRVVIRYAIATGRLSTNRRDAEEAGNGGSR